MADINEAIEAIVRESGLERAALVRFFSSPAFPAFVRAFEELGGDDGWLALNLHEGGVRDARAWAHVEGGKHLV